jgi:3-deoxy-D-manno-octulosonic-acid transferase
MLLKMYKWLFVLLAPFVKIYFYARCLYGKDKVESVGNRFGSANIKRPNGKLIWIHAASIGEATSALTFINYMKEKFPEVNVLLTTVTVTSANVVAPRIAKIKNCWHQFIVADNPFWIRKFLDHWQADAAFFLESEIWPNTIEALHERKIPVVLLNARLSPKSFKHWSFFRESFRSVLKKFSCILVQSEIDLKRFVFFVKDNVKRIDNLKYANALLLCNNQLLNLFKKACIDKKIFVAASTHAKEEEVIIESHKKLRQMFDLITIIIPRHTSRVKEVCDLFRKHKISFSLRSDVNATSKGNSEIFCVDTFGEVGTFLKLADICFVGGSLVPIGGHNIYEPVAFGKPVLHGPFMDNAIGVRDFLKEQQVAFEVKNSDDIYKTCSQFFSNSKKLNKISKLAKNITKNESLNQIDRELNVLGIEKVLHQ